MQQADHGHSANPVGKSTDNAEIFIGEPLRALYEAERAANYIDTLMRVGQTLLHDYIENLVHNTPVGAKPEVQSLGDIADLMGITGLINDHARKQMLAADGKIEDLRTIVSWRRAA